jgi:3-oxoacyl-[acyl-carrier protein] reductase
MVDRFLSPGSSTQPRGPLHGRVALVTGVSRPIGIAYATAERLAVFATGWPAHDDEMPWGSRDLPVARYVVEQRNLELRHEPAALIDAVIAEHGAIDMILGVHARSSHDSLLDVTADELDRCWAANVRSMVLLAQRFAQVRDTSRGTGRLIWFTSGQHLEPMGGEIAYAVSKGALHQMTASINDQLAPYGIIVNCINPGPVDTGYATGEVHQQVASMFPSRRWGQPSDVANLVEFLVGDQGEWIQGQVLNSEGGFNRFGKVHLDRDPAQFDR